MGDSQKILMKGKMPFRNIHFHIHCILFCLLTVSCYPRRCVVEGSRIDIYGGVKLVETLRIGDEVLTKSENGRIETGHVISIQKNKSSQYLHITLKNGRSLQVTSYHPVATMSGWKDARDLGPNDSLITKDGKVEVESVEVKKDKVIVYDISVAPNPNFFANGVLVHNKSIVLPPRLEQLAGIWVGVDDRSRFYRLELEVDGKGRCGLITYWGGDVKIYKISDFKQELYHLSFKLIPVEKKR